MCYLSESLKNKVHFDLDDREAIIRRHIYETLEQLDSPDLSEHIVASYFVIAHQQSPGQVGKEICYHMTSGVRTPPPDSLLDQCTGKVVDSVCFDSQQRCGLVRVAFPLRILIDEQGNLYSSDILHIAAGAGVFALTEHADIKLVHLAMSDATMKLFPGPAYGAAGVRKLTDFRDEDIAFGTILKPCTGITPSEEADIVKAVAGNSMFLFVKEDENYLPGVPFAPLRQRLKSVRQAIEQVREQRQSKGLIFAPHITSPSHLLADRVKQVIDAGFNGVMFSEYTGGGSVRMVREMTRHMAQPPAIYGHNGGISVRTRHIYREVLDLLARLDGIDFRQTAPLADGPALLRPSGQEWRECERVLSRTLAGHPAVMIARAGGLDQGNIVANLLDVSQGAGSKNYLFLAGSAINSIKDDTGHYNPSIGAQAMKQAIQAYRDGGFTDVVQATPAAMKAYAQAKGFDALSRALKQRYGN